MLRKAVPVLGATLTMAFAAAAFATGAGEIACQQSLRSVQRSFEDRAGSMTPGERRDFEQRLSVASRQCQVGLDDASPGITALRQDLAAFPPSQTANEGR